MKMVLLSGIIVLTNLVTKLDANADLHSLSLREHMQATSTRLDDVFIHSQNPQEYAQAARSTRTMRSHLVLAIALNAENLAHADVTESHRNLIEFHQLMAQLIYLTCNLEDALTGKENYQSPSMTRQQDIRHLIREVGDLIKKGRGHWL